MKRLITLVGGTLLASAVSAAGDMEIYGGFAKGNADLSTDISRMEVASAVQPGIGDRFDHYHGFADTNPDLFPGGTGSSTASNSASPDIYQGFGDNPDL